MTVKLSLCLAHKYYTSIFVSESHRLERFGRKSPCICETYGQWSRSDLHHYRWKSQLSFNILLVYKKFKSHKFSLTPDTIPKYSQWIHWFLSHVIPFFWKNSIKKVSGESNYFWIIWVLSGRLVFECQCDEFFIWCSNNF